ncbi:MAG: hypothetical protein O2890_06880 [Cyanobacteria bacterium]|nr:hypothetical protein [Cyanobacteriota bacterium]
MAGKYMRHNQIFRQLLSRETQQLVREEFVTENNALMMYSPLLEPGQ